MADLVVTYSTHGAAQLPIAQGSVADTEQIEIGAASVAGSKSATATRNIVELFAEAACWVSIGTDPTAVAGSGRKMAADEYRQFAVSSGQKVAVIQA